MGLESVMLGEIGPCREPLDRLGPQLIVPRLQRKLTSGKNRPGAAVRRDSGMLVSRRSCKGQRSGCTVNRRDHAAPALVQDMKVDHGRRNVSVAKQFLDSTNVVAGFQQMGGKAVSQRMGGSGLGQLRSDHSVLDRALNRLLIKI